MKATIEFDLPEEYTELKIATEAQKVYWFIWDFYNNELKSKLKHGHKFKTADEALQWVKDRIADEVDVYMDVR